MQAFIGIDRTMIRKYQSADFKQMIHAWRSASELATPFLDEAFLEQEELNIRDIYIPNTETWVYDLDGTVVGFIALAGNEVGAIFLDPVHHGKGIGRQLMDHAAKLHKHLVLDVFKENKVGQRFYFRYGFEIIREHLHEETGKMLLRLEYKR